VERLIERCAGLDVHRDRIAACARVPAEDGGRVAHPASFGTSTAELLRLGDWLEGLG
jgi:hypothetical protein